MIEIILWALVALVIFIFGGLSGKVAMWLTKDQNS